MNKTLALALCPLCFGASAFAQITVSGVADKTVYADQVAFTISPAVGWTYDARLDGAPVPVGQTVSVYQVDYHELSVRRTNSSAAALETALYRFIVRATERAETENGLPPWTPPPGIPSSAAEFGGAHLSLLTPATFPTNCAIPVVAWVLNDAGHAVRANGSLASEGQPTIAIRRGVGSGFLRATNPPGPLDYRVSVAGLQTNRGILIEEDTAWTPIAGTLGGSVEWPAHARIHITNTLTIPSDAVLMIGAGTLVRLSSRTDLKLDGTMIVNGSLEHPVVFFPADAAQPWGGFLLERDTSRLEAVGTIFTGSGAEPNWFGNNGRPGSHRKEQALFYCANAPTITLTDCAAIALAGQLGHSVNGGTITLARFLMQRTTSGGEFTGASFKVNDSAFIECPDDSVDFVDGDNDALYLWSGTHGFTNTLFGWTKDDGVDSGGDGAGLLNFQDCWFESIFHEGNSLSATGKIVNHYRDVFLYCGQGLESGYNGPAGLLDGCLLIGNLTGGRFGDNYDWTYTGSLRATNSILIHNLHDIWGLTWQDWLWRTNAMNIQGNWFTAPIPQHPGNYVWHPETDGARLAGFLNMPSNAPVGVGLAARATQFNFDQLPDGLYARLSTFSPNWVSVDYAIELPGATAANGTLQFPPGEIVRRIPPVGIPGDVNMARVVLRNPTNAEITGLSAVYGVRPATSPNFFLVSTGALWRYLDTGENAGTAWRLNEFNDSGWSNGFAELGYGEQDEATPVRSNGVSGRIITTYFRRAFTVGSPEPVGGLTLRLKRDDGGIVYLNGEKIFRSNITNGPVNYLTRADLADDDGKSWFSTNVPPALLHSGTNLLAVEIHQESTSSSDVSFDLSLEASPRPVVRLIKFGGDSVLAWDDANFLLEQCSDLGPSASWNSAAQTSPAAVAFDAAQRFYRLRKK